MTKQEWKERVKFSLLCEDDMYMFGFLGNVTSFVVKVRENRKVVLKVNK